MSDLVERLRIALDDAEKLARAAGGKTWHISDHNPRRIEGDDIIIYDEGGHSEEQADHIVAWNPARVLALVANDRTLADNLGEAQHAYAKKVATGETDPFLTGRYCELQITAERAVEFWEGLR